MKKTFILLCLSISIFGYSQKKLDFNRDEIKANAFLLILGGALDVSYERLITDDSGLGVSLFLANKEDFETNFYLSPYYRAYFGKK